MNNWIEQFDSYIDEVQADTEGKKHCKSIRSLVDYIAKDLEHHKSYYFDEDEVEKVLNIMGVMPMTKGKYSKLRFKDVIMPWKVFFIACLYG